MSRKTVGKTSEAVARLRALRKLMGARRLTHYLVPSSDEHLNEYLPPWGKRREWLSGFSGSAGDLLVGSRDAWLFADGRYHIQAEAELRGSAISLSKVGATGHQSLPQRLTKLAVTLGKRMRLGFDPWVLAARAAEGYQRLLEPRGASLVPVAGNLVDRVRGDRPSPPTTQLVPVPLHWSGQATAHKLQQIRQDLKRAGADALFVVKLDQLAWLFNLRSKDDVPFNPVFEGYGWVDGRTAHLFVHAPEHRLPPALCKDLEGVVLHGHDEFAAFLGKVPVRTRVLLDSQHTTVGVLQALRRRRLTLVAHEHPVEARKARKNAVEQEAMRRANLRASAAKTRALLWLREQVRHGQTVTERSFQEQLEWLYRCIEDYWGLSFDTISATGAHGAIVHYKNADRTPLRKGDLFLIDSGTHNSGGTTDDTRTVAVGACDAERRRLYTRVLQAHIAAASQVFPAGTSGQVLDAICRAPLWRDQLHYDHGTGHGVGSLLNVHEGPFSISPRRPAADVVLQAGMITSIEPGYYREGMGGIRLENLYLVVSAGKDLGGKEWLRFEPLTFVPFDSALIDRHELSGIELQWLDHYHARVQQELVQELTPEELSQLVV